MKDEISPGDLLLAQLSALASAPRLRIVAELRAGRQYVSELARKVGLSRPLTQMHLRRLEEAGLLESHFELSDDGKAMRFYQLVPFSLAVDAGAIAKAVQSLTKKDDERQ